MTEFNYDKLMELGETFIRGLKAREEAVSMLADPFLRYVHHKPSPEMEHFLGKMTATLTKRENSQARDNQLAVYVALLTDMADGKRGASEEVSAYAGLVLSRVFSAMRSGDPSTVEDISKVTVQ
jgi:hypothetical protein